MNIIELTPGQSEVASKVAKVYGEHGEVRVTRVLAVAKKEGETEEPLTNILNLIGTAFFGLISHKQSKIDQATFETLKKEIENEFGTPDADLLAEYIQLQEIRKYAGIIGQ